MIDRSRLECKSPRTGNYFLSIVAALFLLGFLSNDANAQDMYIFGASKFSCYDIPSCFAKSAAYKSDPNQGGFGVTFGNCTDIGSSGPHNASGGNFLIRVLARCERLSPPPTGVFGNGQYDSYTYGVWPDCAQGSGVPPSCPNEFVLVEAEQPSKSCNESNPCDPANGNKTQTEVDYAPGSTGGLQFARVYNSKGAYNTAAELAPGWRHNYSRSLNEQPDKVPFPLVSSSTQSAAYGSRTEACLSGWSDIKGTAYSGDFSLGTASYDDDNTCKIEIGGSTVAHLRVRTKFGAPINPRSTIRILTQPDGSSYRFESSAGVWSNEFDPSVKFEQVGNNFVFTDKNDTKETYNSSGQLSAVTNRNGQTETLAYNLTVAQGGDANGSTLDRVTGEFGHEITFAYIAGRLDTVTTPNGTFQYAYDANGNLDTVTNPDLSIRAYHYEDATFVNHLTGITDENLDRFSTWSYDSEGRAVTSEHAGGKELVSFAYNGNGTTTLTTANGASRTYSYSGQQGQRKLATLTGDACSGCPGGDIADRTYDANGFLDEVVDWEGNTTQTIRNALGLTEALIEAKGSTEERTTTTAWHGTYRIPTQIVSPKNTTDFTHDTDGNVLTATVSSGGLSRAWTLTYNADGQPLTIDGPRTDVTDLTTITYYTCTIGNECGQINTISNALSQVTTYNSYDAAGRPTLFTDANGLQTSLTYDWRGDILTTTQSPTVGSPRTTTMTYDDVGQLATLSTPDATVLTYVYTAAHYLASVTDNLGNHIDYDYDAMGNLLDEDTYDSGSTLKRAVDYAYDLNSRLDTITNGGFLSDISIDMVGNLTNQVDPEFASTIHSYDALNRLDQTIDALTGVISYDYDDHDNITSVIAANGATTNYQYDDLDNLTSEISGDRGTLVYTYDEAGNRKTAFDARGKTTSYNYDALNRLTLVTFDDLSTIAYQYDIGLNAAGRRNKITDSSGTTTWTYDNFGAVTQKVQTIGGVTVTTGYTYDTSGRLLTMTYPSGMVVTYTYNTYLQTGISVDGNAILSAATYDPFGPVNGWTWGNGSFASRNFDLRGVATSIDFAGDTQTLGHDNAGQVISQLDSNVNALYDYDLLGRLTDFTNNNAGGGGSPPEPMFTAAPVILANIQTAANETGSPPSGNPTPWMTASVRNVGAANVQLALGRAEVNTGSISVAETLGYIAIQGGASGSFSANGGTVSYEAQTTTDSVRGWGNGCYTTNFLSTFSSSPTVVATINRLDGGDGGWARRCSLSTGAVGLSIDEDQFKDSERNHTTEAVGMAVFSQSFDATFNDGVSSWGMEAESVSLPAVTGGSGWVNVNFRQSYSAVPIVVVLATNETSDPSAIRVRNVTTTGFEAAQVEPANNDGMQGVMTMHYVAVEPGAHELPDGTRILADTVSLSNQQHGSGVTGSESWVTEAFDIWPGASGSTLPASQVMAYDANGNRSSLTEDSVLYSYSNLVSSNRVLSAAGPVAKTYSYDLSGNVTADGVHVYGYDDRGRLVDADSGSATYVHNGQGERVKKDNGSVTLFAYDEVGGLVGEYDSAGVPTQETVWFNGEPVAVLDGANRYYIHTDQLGSPRAITDGNTVIWRWQSDPFGASVPNENPDGDANSFTYNLRFPGQYYDVETGLHYNYFRTYDPSTGRYLESDPIGLAGGLNTYGYAYQNPLSYTDRYGRSPAHLAGLITGAVVGGLSAVIAGGDLSDAVSAAAQGGAAGFLSAGGSVFIALASSAVASALSDYFKCGEVSGKNALVNVGYALAGGAVGRGVAGLFVGAKKVRVPRGRIGSALERIGAIGPKIVDAMIPRREAVSAAIGAGVESGLAGRDSVGSACECSN